MVEEEDIAVSASVVWRPWGFIRGVHIACRGDVGHSGRDVDLHIMENATHARAAAGRRVGVPSENAVEAIGCNARREGEVRSAETGCRGGCVAARHGHVTALESYGETDQIGHGGIRFRENIRDDGSALERSGRHSLRHGCRSEPRRVDSSD